MRRGDIPPDETGWCKFRGFPQFIAAFLIVDRKYGSPSPTPILGLRAGGILATAICAANEQRERKGCGPESEKSMAFVSVLQTVIFFMIGLTTYRTQMVHLMNPSNARFCVLSCSS